MTTTQLPSTLVDDLPVYEWPKGTVDFFGGTVTDRNGNDLDMTVEIAITPAWDADATHTWLPAGFLGTAAATRQCQTTNVVDTSLLTGGSDGIGTRYGVYARLDNTPAHPIVQLGWLILTD